MSILSVESIELTTNNLGKESSVPSILALRNGQQVKNSNLSEYDEVYAGYGFVDGVFPYPYRDLYDAVLDKKEYKSVVLENEYLKAVFLPELGGRLWSLFDKENGKELLLSGDRFAFANLATRDAWFCGGVEWNVGIVGHSPFTCEKLYTALTETDDGTPVLRFYEYERIRRCTYQLDFWLPDGSKRLYAGVRIVNPNDDVVPMYWWSNIAVEEDENSRVVAPASEAYTQLKGVIEKVKTFKTEDKDITYPVQNKTAVDYFWRTKDAERKFVSYLNKDGFGLCQASSSRQMGRKLFVWGQHKGADSWQKLLKVKSNNGHYIEIQAGLAQTQYECLPMPPHTAWEWVESYGSVKIDAETAHGEYENAWRSVDKIVGEEDLEEILKNASHMRRKAEKIIQHGSVWGKVEDKKREALNQRPLSANLEFCCEGENEWINLLTSGTLGIHNPTDVPPGWMLDEEFTSLLESSLLEKDSHNWYSWMHCGVINFANKNFDKSRECFEKSLSEEESIWSYYGLMCVAINNDDTKKSAQIAKKLLSMTADNISIIRIALDVLVKAGEYDLVLEYTKKLSEKCFSDSRVLIASVKSMIQLSMFDEAEEIMDKYKDVIFSNLREGELTATNLRIEVLRHKAEKSGLPTDSVEPELEWDFRLR